MEGRASSGFDTYIVYHGYNHYREERRGLFHTGSGPACVCVCVGVKDVLVGPSHMTF